MKLRAKNSASVPDPDAGSDTQQTNPESWESQIHFRVLVDAMPQLAWMAHPDGHIFWYNKRWYDFTGTTPKEMEGWGWQSTHDPAELPLVLKRWQASIRTGDPFEMEFPLRGRDGIFKWFLTQATPLMDSAGKLERWFGTNTDVTDIREARESLSEREAENARRNDRLQGDLRHGTHQLQQSNERYRALIDNIQDYAILMLNPEGRVATWNSSAQAMQGYSAAEILGRHVSCFYPPEEIEAGLPEHVLQRAAIDGHFEHEGRRIRKDGSSFWAKVMVTALRDETGELFGYSKMTRDISESKRAEEKLRNQTVRLQEQAALLDLAHDAIFVKTEKAFLSLFWNAGAAEVYGWTAEQALGQPSHVLLKTIFPQPLEEIEAEVSRSGQWEGELIQTRSDGSVITVASRWALRRGSDSVILQIDRDITRQKSAERDLKDVHERLSLALKGGRIGTWAWDLPDNVLTCDDHLAAMFGLPAGSTVRDLHHFTSLVHPADREYLHKQLGRGLETGTYDAEFRVPLGAGKLRFIAAHGEISYRDDRPARLTGAFWDLTQHKEFEAELQVKTAELERFTYAVSHDLKSPLITIKSFVGMIDQDLADGSVERARSDLRRIGKAADRMNKLLEELLTLSRLGRLVSTPESVPFGTLVQEALELVAGQIQDRCVQVDVAKCLPCVTVDRPRIVEVLQNLIDNASKFLGDRADPQIWIGTRSEGTEIRFFVKDNGIGLEPRHHAIVFGLFNKLNPKSEGSGAGLALVKRIIEMHGGRIWIESSGAGSGSTFWFTLAPTSVHPAGEAE